MTGHNAVVLGHGEGVIPFSSNFYTFSEWFCPFPSFNYILFTFPEFSDAFKNINFNFSIFVFLLPARMLAYPALFHPVVGEKSHFYPKS